MKIYLKKEAYARKDEIEQMLEKLALYDCNFGDTSWEILQDENFSYVDHDDESVAVLVIDRIQGMLEETL